MTQIKVNQSKKTTSYKQINPVETLGSLDQFFGQFSESDQDENRINRAKEQKKTSAARQEFSIFNYQNYYEREVVKRQIKELTEQIKKEIEYIKKADASLISEIKDVEKLTVEALPEKPGIYHVRFLEIILRILKSLREKIGESRTWLSAMVSRKKKRGSLFAVLSKKKGTQYSLSQELTNARSIQ